MHAPVRGLDTPPLTARSPAATLAIAAGATLLTLASEVGPIVSVDPDDSMRLVEVRNWLGGQSWFDMTMARLDPPAGSFMHWSRLVDMPAAGAVRLFGLFLPMGTAELLASIVVPALWLFALYLAMLRLGAVLLGPAARWPIVVATFLCGVTLVQFAPGRVGHHAPETVTLLIALASTLEALDPPRGRAGLVAGLSIALSLAMSLETLPFHVVLIAALVALWIRRGASIAPALFWLGAGLMIGLPLTFLVTVGPSRWVLPVCDAYGAAHLGAGLIGGLGLMGLSRLPHHGSSPRRRGAAAALLAVVAFTFLALCYPACLHSPFAGVDPLVRALWLNNVVESFTLPRLWARQPMLSLALVAPLALGLFGALAAVRLTQGATSLRFAVIAALVAAGLALSFWQVRVVASVTPIAVTGGVFAALQMTRHAARGRSLLAILALIPFTGTAWALGLPDDHVPRAAGQAKAACLTPAAFAPLAGLPAGTAVAPMDSGAHLLRYTSLDVFAGPYHRNDDGNRFMFEVFLASPKDARALLASRKVTYVIVCPGMADLTHIVDQAPGGLAAELLAGRVPAYLTRQPLAGTPYRVYAVAN